MLRAADTNGREPATMDGDTMRYTPPEVLTSIGALVRARRQSLDIRIETMSKKLQVTSDQYRRMERGNYVLSLTKLLDICNLLDCDIQELLPPGNT